MQLGEKVISLEGYIPADLLPPDPKTYPYAAPLNPDPWYTAPLPLSVDELNLQTPIINNTVDSPPLVKFQMITLYGTIVDEKGKPVNGATMAFRVLGSNVDDVPAQPVVGNTYGIETPAEQIGTYGAMFRASGYTPYFVPLETLQQTPTVILHKGNSIPVWQIALVVAAVYAYRQRTKKVGSLGMGDLLPIFILVGGIIGFDLIKKILTSLGIWDSADTKDLDEVETDPGSPWSPNFYKLKPANIPWTYVLTNQQAVDYAVRIWESFGAFNDCEDCVKAVFKSMRTKANVSFLADVFQTGYQQELLSYLRGGNWPDDHLSDADVNEINNYVNALPKY